jgi:hypothetical protein
MAAGGGLVGIASPDSAREFVGALEFGAAEGTESSLLLKTGVPALRAPLAVLLGVRKAGLEAAQAISVVQPATGTDPVGLKIKVGQDQAFVVGSQLLSFNSDVTEDRRAAAVNSCLLAQLRASKLHPSPDTPEAAEAWHATYVNTLVNVGWVLESGITAAEKTGAKDASVDKVLLQVIEALLPGGTAVALAGKVIDAISKAKSDDPFIVLYQSRVVQQSVVEFGAGLGSGAGAGFVLSVVECAMQVSSNQQQFLFFKWNADSASADGRRFDFGIADGVYAAARPIIEQKLAPYVRNFVANLDI